jgi:hypothetical protein
MNIINQICQNSPQNQGSGLSCAEVENKDTHLPQRTNVLPHLYISSTITAKKKNTIPSYFKGSSA